jgi:glycolate oxidase FAD binding subunit
VLLPETIDDTCRMVRQQSERKQAIYPVGGRTMLGLGLSPAREGVALDTTRLDRVIDYPSRDMTITVEAGIRVARLQELLSQQAQRLPVDVPHSGSATLGGTIATNTSGPRRYGFGTIRDYVIGISVVNADGTETKAGGRVVKNVAGYDLCKVYTGSHGSLGVISQVTLKLRPTPNSSSFVVVCPRDLEQVRVILERLNTSRARPVAIDLLNAAALERVPQLTEGLEPVTAPWAILIGIEENNEAVTWQMEQLASELKEFKPARIGPNDKATCQLWDCLVQFQSLQDGGVTIKANLLSSRLTEWLNLAMDAPQPWSILAHAGNGIGYAHSPTDINQAEAMRCITAWRAAAVAQGGNLVVRRCPTDWKRDIAVWGSPRSDSWLMQAIKRKLDPDAIMNPGRFIE